MHLGNGIKSSGIVMDKIQMKKVMEIIISLLVAVYIGVFSIGGGGGGGGCEPGDDSEIDNPPEDTQTLHDRILAAAQNRMNFNVP